MDTRDIGAILLKVGGLLLIAFGVGSLPAFFSALSVGGTWSLWQSIGAAAVTVGPTVVLGVVFWSLPGTIVNRIVSGPPSLAKGTEPSLRSIEAVALTLVGVYLAARALIDVSYLTAYVVVTDIQQPEHEFLSASIISRVFAIVVEFVIGVVLCLRARGVSRLLARARRDPGES